MPKRKAARGRGRGKSSKQSKETDASLTSKDDIEEKTVAEEVSESLQGEIDESSESQQTVATNKDESCAQIGPKNPTIAFEDACDDVNVSEKTDVDKKKLSREEEKGKPVTEIQEKPKNPEKNIDDSTNTDSTIDVSMASDASKAADKDNVVDEPLHKSEISSSVSKTKSVVDKDGEKPDKTSTKNERESPLDEIDKDKQKSENPNDGLDCPVSEKVEKPNVDPVTSQRSEKPSSGLDLADSQKSENLNDDLADSEKSQKPNDDVDVAVSCEQIEEIEDEEEVYMDKEVDDDVQYIDEEIDEEVVEEGDQDLLDVIEMGDDQNNKAGYGKETTKAAHRSKSQDCKEELANTTFEEISEGSMDPMEQDEVIVEAISDNEMIIESSSQETDEKKERPRNRKRNRSREEDETLADIFEVTEKDDDQIFVEVHDKDNDDISDASLIADDEAEERNNLSLEEISDDELDSSKKKKVVALSQPSGLGDQEKDKNVEDTNTVSDSETKIDESSSKDIEKNEESLKEHPNKDENESVPSKQSTLTNVTENSVENHDAPNTVEPPAKADSEKEKTTQPNVPLQSTTDDLKTKSNDQAVPPLLRFKSTDVSAQTEYVGRKGKIVQCNISRCDGLSLKDEIKVQDPETKLKDKVSDIFTKYKSHLPSSVVNFFTEVAAPRIIDEGVFSLSLGPVTLSDIGNDQFRHICLNLAEKFNITFNSKMQGLLQAQFSKYKEVNGIIRDLKTLDLGIRYLMVSLMYRTNLEDSSQHWQALLVLTYSQDESHMKAWTDGNDGKVRSRLSVKGVPDGISKDFVHLLFPEALYISTDLKTDSERALTLGFSSTKITKDISSRYELLLFDGNKVEIASMDPVECNAVENSIASGFIEEDGIVVVEDVDEANSPSTRDENNTESIKDANEVTMDTPNVGTTTDEGNKEECKEDEKDSRESNEIVKEKSVPPDGDKTPNEANKDDTIDESLNKDGRMEVRETPMADEKEQGTEPMVFVETGKDKMMPEERQSENKDLGADRRDRDQSSDQIVVPSDEVIAISADAVGSNLKEKENERNSKEKSSQSRELLQDGEACKEMESVSEDDGKKNSDCDESVDKARSEEVGVENVSSESQDQTGQENKTETADDAEKASELQSDQPEKKQNTEKDNLEDVSDDDMVESEAAKAVESGAVENNDDDDDDVIILKEEPSTKVVATIDLTVEETDPSKNAEKDHEEKASGEVEDKPEIKKEIKVEDLVDEDKLTMKDGSFDVVLQSIDVDEDEIEFMSEMIYENHHYGDYRGKYYNSSLKRNITMTYYRNRVEEAASHSNANQKRQQPQPLFAVTCRPQGYDRRGSIYPPSRPQPSPPQFTKAPYHNVERPPAPRQDFNYNRVYRRPEQHEVRKESHLKYDKMSPVHSGSSLGDDYENDPKFKSRHPVAANQETAYRREQSKRDYRRSGSTSPRRDVMSERAKDSSYHHSNPSTSQPRYSSTTTHRSSYNKTYRDPRAVDSPPHSSRQPQHHQPPPSSSYYDYKNTRPADENNPTSRSRQGSSKYETSKGWRAEDYHPPQHQKPMPVSTHPTQTRHADKPRSFSPLSASSSELLSRSSPPNKRRRKVSNSPISASSRSLSPISKSPSPPLRYYSTQAAKPNSNKYRSSPPKAYKDGYSPISTKDLDTGRSGVIRQRSRSRSPYKGWDRDRSRKRSKSPQYRRRSPSPAREKIHSVGTAAAYRSSHVESAKSIESSRNRQSSQGSGAKVSKYEKHIKALYENKSNAYKKSALDLLSSTLAAVSKKSSNPQPKQKQGDVGSAAKSAYSKPINPYGQTSSSTSAQGYSNTSSAAQQSHPQHAASHVHPQSYNPSTHAMPHASLPPQQAMYYPTNQAMYGQYNMGGAAPYQAYNQPQQQQQQQQQAMNNANAMMYNLLQKASSVINPASSNNPYSAYTHSQQMQQHQHQHQQHQHQQHQHQQHSGSSISTSANLKSSSSSNKPGNVHGQSSDKSKHWSMGDGGNALMFQRILSSKKGGH